MLESSRTYRTSEDLVDELSSEAWPELSQSFIDFIISKYGFSFEERPYLGCF